MKFVQRPLPTIRLLNERLINPPENHRKIITAMPRFHTTRVIRD